jgi:predicted phosphodiesterase
MRITRILVLPDIHAPKEDKPSLKAALAFAADFKPNIVVQLGDLCDFFSLSRFDVVRERDLVSLHDEIESANRCLDGIEKAVGPKCRKIFLEGNHDARPEKYRLNSWDKSVQKIWGKRLGNFNDLYNLKERGWIWRDYGEAYKIGHAHFTHGWFVNKYHAAKTVTKWFKTVFYGHTHTHQVHTVVGMDQLPVSAVSIGTLSRFDLDYLKGIPPDWVHMFAYIYMLPNGTFTAYTPTIINGRFVAEGTLYDGNKR